MDLIGKKIWHNQLPIEILTVNQMGNHVDLRYPNQAAM
jgi:hypothetical protein